MSPKREFAASLSSCEFEDVKFKYEIFMRIDMKHSYFSIICLPSFFSVVEIIIELFVVCQNIIHVYA